MQVNWSWSQNDLASTDITHTLIIIMLIEQYLLTN